VIKLDQNYVSNHCYRVSADISAKAQYGVFWAPSARARWTWRQIPLRRCNKGRRFV